ncbi:MAG: SusC/RagA family TonB-linked outer membrane protein [Gemmatimonadota bacterium]
MNKTGAANTQGRSAAARSPLTAPAGLLARLGRPMEVQMHGTWMHARYSAISDRLGYATLLAFSLTAVLGSGTLRAQQGAITGTITDAETLAPQPGVQVFIAETVIGTVTNQQGSYRLEGVPAGAATITVRLIGYHDASQIVTVTAGQVATADFQLEQTALRLQDIVVTGVVGATPRVMLPFTVERIDAEEMPVPASNALDMLAARAAGVQVSGVSGQPGQTGDVILRGPTSIDNEGRNQSPLIVIDGVIQSKNATLGDVSALDIASVEIVKGAAAASLYGSRAQAGVIQITTKRGIGLQNSTTDFILRGEYGTAQLIGDSPFPRNHPWLMNEDGTKFIDSFGNEVDYLEFSGMLPDGTPTGSPVLADEGGDPATSATSFQQFEYPNAPLDQLKAFYDPGETWTGYGALAGRDRNFGYRVSGDYYSETGIVDCGEACRNPVALENFGDDYSVRDDGYRRTNARINIDARPGNLEVAASGFYSRSTQDDVARWVDAFHQILAFSPFVDLTRFDDDGIPLLRADPLSLQGNPLHSMATTQAVNERARTMGGVDLRYPITEWLSVEANASYDRTAFLTERVVDKRNQDHEDGSLEQDQFDEEAVNASFTAAFAESFLDGRLVTRARARVLRETQRYDQNSARGSRFSVDDVPNFGAITGPIALGNENRQIRSRGYFAIVGVEYEGRYILDGLIRRDGSSLFGPDERWQTYYRGSAAWRLTREPWWGVDWVDELKLRASIGSAGGRPNFFARYETYAVEAGGIFPRILGNTALRPEHSLEREIGANVVLFNTLAVDLTYAWATTDDQILRAPQPGYVGFQERWVNAGQIDSRTWEASIRWAPVDGPDTGLSFRMNLDQTYAQVTRLDIPSYFQGGFFRAAGEPFGALWGNKMATNCAEVAAGGGRLSTAGFDCSQFAVNDDDYMVWVGDGNDVTDGIARGLWGTTGEVDGEAFKWGMPIETMAQNRSCLRKNPEDAGVGQACPLQQRIPVGDTNTDLNGAFATNFRHKGLSLNFLFQAALGFDLMNYVRQGGRDANLDQAGKPDGLKKPVEYYRIEKAEFLHQRQFLEPGGWVKLRELSIGYTLPSAVTGKLFGGGINRVTLSAIGRNLLTFTGYSGFDPEVGNTGGLAGSATIDRVDLQAYPNSRSFSLALEFVF